MRMAQTGLAKVIKSAAKSNAVPTANTHKCRENKKTIEEQIIGSNGQKSRVQKQSWLRPVQCVRRFVQVDKFDCKNSQQISTRSDR